MADDIDETDTSILGSIKIAAKAEGYTPGTELFNRRTRQLQIVKCREIRGHSTCLECVAQDDCSLYMQVKIEQRS